MIGSVIEKSSQDGGSVADSRTAADRTAVRRHTLLGVLWTLATICALLSAVLAVNAFGGATGQDGPDRMTATGWDGACAQSLDWPSVLGGRTDQTPRVSGEFSVLPLGVDCTVTVTPLGWTTIVPADWGLTGSLTVMVFFVALAVFSRKALLG